MKKSLSCILLFLLLLAYAIPSGLMAQTDRATLTTAYLNNFATYTQWPEDWITDSFRIAVIDPSYELLNALDQYARNRKINQLSVALYNLGSETALRTRDYHMILLPGNRSALLPRVYDAIADRPILLVSEDYPDKRNIMINLFGSAENGLLFEVNEANIINQGLTIDPEVLLAGGSTLDVARLYRESQQGLREMRYRLRQMDDSLTLLLQAIDENSLNARKLYQELEVSQALLNSQQSELDSLEHQLHWQRSLLNDKQQAITEKTRILEQQEARIQQSLQAYDRQSAELEKLGAMLSARHDVIMDMDREIDEKNNILQSQSRIIARQRHVLMLLATTGLLTLLLILMLYLNYRRNKAKNKLLTAQRVQIFEKLQQLQEMNVKLQHADHYKSIFLASMSHELRTPLNSIIGYTGILLMGLAGELNAEQKNQLKKVKNNGQHLLSLINDVLDISKIEAGRIELELTQFNLNELLLEILETIHPRALDKKLDISAELSDDIPIFTDRRRIKQVLLNLLSNAVNYTEKGSVAIRTSLLEQNRIRISVTDTGVGIPESEMGRLFQPFHQIDSSLTKKNKGTGLGLYLSRKLMKLMQGDIFVSSKPGRGSIFYVELPLRIDLAHTHSHEESADH